jgi:hypothetical protein
MGLSLDEEVIVAFKCQNELGYLEFIHTLVETLDKYFENVVILTLFTIFIQILIHSLYSAN